MAKHEVSERALRRRHRQTRDDPRQWQPLGSAHNEEIARRPLHLVRNEHAHERIGWKVPQSVKIERVEVGQHRMITCTQQSGPAALAQSWRAGCREIYARQYHWPVTAQPRRELVL